MSAEKRVYVRKSTGIVRALSTLDLFNMGIASSAPIAVLWFVPMWAQILFPGSEPGMIVIFAFLPLFFVTLVYIGLATAMPRSGGDYVYMSRTFPPYLGFTFNFFFIITLLVSIGSDLYFGQVFTLSMGLATLGAVLGSPILMATSIWMATTPNVVFILGTVLLVAMCLIAMSRVRTFARVLAVLISLEFISIAVVAIIFAITSRGTFVSMFNKSVFGQYASYEGLKGIASAAGYLPVAITLSASFGAMAWGGLFFSGWNAPVYMGGESKDVGKAMPRSLLLALVAVGVSMIISVWMMDKCIGDDFLYSAFYLYNLVPGKYPYPIATYPITLAAMVTGWWPVALLLAVGPFGAYLMNDSVKLLNGSRCMFAWSFDRIFPEAIANVSERRHSPTVSVLVMGAGSWICLCVAVYTGVFNYYANASAMWFLCYAFVALCAIVFPIAKPDLLEHAPSYVRKRVFGIPVMSIYALVASAFLIYGAGFSLTNPAMGPTQPAIYALIVGTLLVGVIIYFAARYYRLKKEGTDIGLAFKALAPE